MIALSATPALANNPSIPNPLADAQKELREGLNKTLGSIYNGIGRWVRSWKEPTQYPTLEPPRPRDHNLITGGEIVMQGPSVVMEGALAHHFVSYPAAYGELYISFTVTGEGVLLTPSRLRNEYQVMVSARNPGFYTITATVHRLRTDEATGNFIDNPFDLTWRIEVQRRRPLPCEPPTMELAACNASCSIDDGNLCIRKRIRVDGSGCYACESYLRRSSSSSSTSSRTSSSSSSLPTDCTPPSVEYAQCRSNCPYESTCIYVGATNRNTACYVCEAWSSSSSPRRSSSNSSSRSSRSSSSSSSSSPSSSRSSVSSRPMTQGGDDGGEHIGVQGGETGGETQDCNSVCGEQGMYVGTDHTEYIRQVLDTYTCVSGANASIEVATFGDCTCSRRPNVAVDETVPVCTGSPCGDVQCGETVECEVEDTVYTTTCNWRGWENIGENQFRPQVGG